MNRSICRIAVIVSSFIVASSVVYLVRTGFRDGAGLFRKLMYIALSFLIVASIFALRQRSIDWKDRPEKRRHLRAVKAFVILMIVIMVPVAFVFFR